MTSKLNREELAALEVGHTTVSRSLAKSIVFCFILFIFSVPVLQEMRDRANPEQQSLLLSLQELVQAALPESSKNLSFFSRIKKQNTQLLEGIDSLEDQLEEESFLRINLLAPGQRMLLSLGYGNEKVYPGKGDWLFYRPDMDYLMGPGFLDPQRLQQRREAASIWEEQVQPDPIQTILDFNNQLARRGIQLILMPTPVKAGLHPQFFTSDSYQPPLQNGSWPDFLDAMEGSGIPLFDPAPLLVKHSRQLDVPVYLQTDTHWRPDAMEVVAEQLALFVQTKVSLSDHQTVHLVKQQEKVSNRGDIDDMLRIPDQWNPYPKEEVQLHAVVTQGKELWQAATDAEILLLGDSFSNIYSFEGMDWGAGAGLGEQLSFALQRSVDVISQNDSGAFATRELLSKELSRGRDRLAGKKVVVWQFAVRELASGDWKEISMELQERQVSEFYTPLAGEIKVVDAVVAATSRSPVPGSVPYKDNVVTLHLDDIRDVETNEEYGQALIYAWGMRDNTLTPFAKLRIGEKITMRLVDWDTVQGQYSSYRRSTLDDEMLELELPVWGEVLP